MLLRSTYTLFLLLTLTAFVSCSDDAADGTLSDAAAGDSGEASGDGGSGQDVGDETDSGSVDSGSSGQDASSGGNDGSSGLGPACMALEDCCPELPMGQTRDGCENAVAGGEESSCQRALNLANFGGYCVPDGGPQNDAGPPVDAGPLGPVCQELLDCCPNLPMILQGICENAANGRDEGQCQQALDLASNQCMSSMTDAGTSTTADAG